MDYTLSQDGQTLVFNTDDPTAYASWVGFLVGKHGPAVGVEVRSEKTGKTLFRDAVMDIEFAPEQKPRNDIDKLVAQMIAASPGSNVSGVTQIIR